MVNVDTIIKVVRERGYKTSWPDETRYVMERLKFIKLGFPGIRNDHLSFIEFKNIKSGEIFIFDHYLEKGVGDEAPIMLKMINPRTFFVEGIGIGEDSVRDPDKVLIKWRDTISYDISPDSLVLRVDVRPTLNGGPGYYYFFKSYRDFRP